MTMRLDIVTNDAGEMVRREHARELGAGVVVALYRLARLAQVHDLGNQAFLRQLEQTHQIISDYCLRSGASVNILFAQKAVFVAGQLLKGSRGAYDSATELGDILARCGGSELTIARDVTQPELLAFAEAISMAMRTERGRPFRLPTSKIRLRAVNDAARLRGLELESLTFEQRVVRNYASAVVILRRFFEDLQASHYILPRRIKRVAQNLVDLSGGTTPAFLGVTEVRNQNHDDAGRAVNTAILAVAMAREVTDDRGTLAQIAMAAMMHDVGRPRAAAAGSAGGPRMSALAARLSEEAEDRLAAGTAAVLTALGRVNEPSITRTVVAFESLWIRRQAFLGPVYRGARAPTLHARIIAIARRYNDLLTPAPGLAPIAPDAAVAILSDELAEPADRTLLRMLVAALGLFPVGTVVMLSTGEVAEVIFGPDRQTVAGRPRVRIVMDAQGGVLPAPIEVDLGNPRAGDSRRIMRVMSTEGWRKGLEGSRAVNAAPRERETVNPAARARTPSESGVASRSAIVTTELRPTSGVPAAMAATVAPAAPTVAPGPANPPEMRPRIPSLIEDSMGATPSAVADAMGRMIEEALRGGASPTPAPHIAPTVAPVPLPTAAPAAPAPPAPPTPPRPGKEWTVTDTAPNARNESEPPGAGAHTVSELKAAAPVAAPISQPPAAGPTARGTIGSTPLAHVLVYMLDHGLTGTVVFGEADGSEHHIYFQGGTASKVRIARPTALIGEELVGAGLLASEVLPEALDGAQRLGVLIGEYLVGHDLVTREALARALETQVASKVASIVNLPPETTYSFYRDVDLLGAHESDGTMVDPLNVVLATVRTWDDRARIRATLARIAKHALVFHPQADPLSLALTPAERAVVEAIRGQSLTASQLFQRRLADEETVSSLLYVFAVTRQFGFKGQKGPPMRARAPIPISVAPPASVSLPAAVAVGPAPEAPKPQESPATWGPPPAEPSPSERPRPDVNRTNGEGGVAEQALEAMTSFRLAESALQRGDVAQAERLAAKAAKGDPHQGDYVALYTWIKTMGMHTDAATLDAIAVLTRIIDAEPTERALLYRGKLQKRMKRMREALRDFERVLQLNPKHREAASEVRLLKQSRAR